MKGVVPRFHKVLRGFASKLKSQFLNPKSDLTPNP